MQSGSLPSDPGVGSAEPVAAASPPSLEPLRGGLPSSGQRRAMHFEPGGCLWPWGGCLTRAFFSQSIHRNAAQ